MNRRLRHDRDEMSRTLGRTPLMFRNCREIEILLCHPDCVAYTFVREYETKPNWPAYGWTHSYGCPVNGSWDFRDES